MKLAFGEFMEQADCMGDNRIINKTWLSDISIGEDIRKWYDLKDKLAYKDVRVVIVCMYVIVCIPSLTGYFFHLFIN